MIPGISPRRARFRKHKRQSWNFRRKPRGRPQIWQRLRRRTLNFGVFFAFAILAVVAIRFLFSAYFRKGMPRCLSRASASGSLWAVVTMVMFMPLAFSTLE